MQTWSQPGLLFALALSFLGAARLVGQPAPPAAERPSANAQALRTPAPPDAPNRPPPPDLDGPPDGFGPPPGFGPRGPGPGGFDPNGPGGPNYVRPVVAQFDKDGDGRLNREERQAARAWLKTQGGGRRFGGPGGRRGGFGPGGEETATPPQPGRKLTPAEVPAFPDAPVYDPFTLRTFFLEFESADWEQELADFNNTDVEVPATVIVDGRTYRDVGVHFRGATSFMFVPAGRKRPLNLSFDFVHPEQNLGGYRTFNLLNAHEDPSFLRAVLYLQIARDYLPAARANFVRVVINGECWGIYVNVQQFNKDFVRDGFGTAKGARWKVPGSPQTRAGLEYLGEDPEPYRRLFQLKTKDSPEVWADLIRLCRVLNQTETAALPAALEPLLDVDEVLRFLAVDLTLINNDGYWVRSSDYNLYQDKRGRFHVLPHDVNETFAAAGGPGMRGPGSRGGFRGGPGGSPGGSGVELDPLVGLDDPAKPLRSRLLAVPEYRTRYLGYVRDIAERWLDWNHLGPLARRYHDLIADDVKADTRKLFSTEAFLRSLEGPAADAPAPAPGPGAGRPRFGPGGEKMPLKEFAERRRAYLLNHPAVQAVPALKPPAR